MDRIVSSERVLQRRRSAALIAMAVIVIAVASVAYLHSTSTPKTHGTSQSINPLLATPNPVSYDFVTPSRGWAGENAFGPSGGPGQFRVFGTVDGARHWAQQLAGPFSSQGFVPLSVQFFDQRNGFMEVGRPIELYRTSDAGAHWQSVELPTPPMDTITFSDLNHGWSLGSPNSLYATLDGGNSWKRLPDPPADAYSLAFRSTTEVWMGSSGSGIPHVYLSSDAGATWQKHDLPPPPVRTWNAGPYLPMTVDLLPGLGVVASLYALNSSLLFTSFDAGMTWSYVPPPPGQVAYQDARHWWAIGSTMLFKSSNAGQTWIQVTDTLPDWGYIPHVIDSQHAWAEISLSIGLGNGYGLAFTNDGGLHWTQAKCPAADLEVPST